MAFASGNVAVFQMDLTEGGALTDISAYVQSVKLSPKRKNQKLPVIGGGDVKKMVGPVDTEIHLTGWIDPTVTAGFTSYVSDQTPTTRSILYMPQGSATGLPRRSAEVFIVDYEEDTDADNPGKWTATLDVDGAVTYASNP